MDDGGFTSGFLDEGEGALLSRLASVEAEHAALDREVADLQASGADQITLQRLKKKKLRLKDELVWLRDRSTPDIIA
jgi:hypothetical protein